MSTNEHPPQARDDRDGLLAISGPVVDRLQTSNSTVTSATGKREWVNLEFARRLLQLTVAHNLRLMPTRRGRIRLNGGRSRLVFGTRS